MSDTGLPAVRERARLVDISSRTWEHPADKGALVALRQLAGFDVILRKLASLWDERALRLVYLGSAVRVDERQFARLHVVLHEAATALDVADVPELYVVASPELNAMAIGVDRPIIVVNSRLVELFDDDELRFVLGHELGHVLSGHALYTTMLLQLIRLSAALSAVPLGALGLRAVIAALSEWSRKAEISCDRAGLLAGQDPGAAQRAHMKLAGGGSLDDVDVTAFRAQGDEYLGTTDVRDSVLKLLLVEARTHPFAVLRAAELRRWVDGGAYPRILQGEYPRRSDDATASARAEVADAARHYKEAFEHSQDPIVGFLRAIGSTVGDTVGGAVDWVASRFTKPPEA